MIVIFNYKKKKKQNWFRAFIIQIEKIKIESGNKCKIKYLQKEPKSKE